MRKSASFVRVFKVADIVHSALFGPIASGHQDVTPFIPDPRIFAIAHLLTST